MERLTHEVDDDADIVGQFVADYLGLLDHRMARLRQLLASHAAVETIRVHILSLETTSAMLGAGEVVARASALRQAVADRQPTTVLFEQLLEATDALGRSLTG